jgi:hypothetical protein
MRTLFLITLALAIALPSMSEGKGKRRNRKKKRDSIEVVREYEKLKKLSAIAPGHVRWFESFRDRPRIKINHIDASDAPTLKLQTTILEGDRRVTVRPIDWDKVFKLEVRLSKGPEDDLELIGVFKKNLDDEEDEEDGPNNPVELTKIDAMGIPLDVVVIAAGHSGFKHYDQLESAHKAATVKVLKELLNARTNVFWVGPTLFTFRNFPGITNELSRYDEDVALCEIERLRYRRSLASDDAEERQNAAKPSCGLQADDWGGKHQADLIEKMRYRGKYTRLFGINRTGISECAINDLASTELDLGDLDADLVPTSDRGAFEEALIMLLRYGTPDSRKAIIVLGDGKDGFIEEDEACNEYLRSKGPCAKLHEQFEKKGRKSHRKISKAIEKCVRGELSKRSTGLQERFHHRARPWLALARSAGIRVYAIGYAMSRGDQQRISEPYERERLELLAAKTGGTYREIAYVEDVESAAEALIAEFNEVRVITVEAPLVSEQTHQLQLSASIVQEVKTTKDDETVTRYLRNEIVTKVRTFQAPFIGEGFGFWLEQKHQWLRDTVHPIWYWLIIIGLCILALLLIWLIFALIKKLVMKIVKGFSKKAKNAAKGGLKTAAKGSSGQGKGA